MKPEMFLQVQFVQWLDGKHILYNASPAGVKLPMLTAVNLKRAGCKKGYPDIVILHAQGGYHGLFIELKAGDNTKVTPEQRAWQEALEQNGYKALIMPGKMDFSTAFEWLKKQVLDYMLIPHPVLR